MIAQRQLMKKASHNILFNNKIFFTTCENKLSSFKYIKRDNNDDSATSNDEDLIEAKRNKSGLRRHHHQMLSTQVPTTTEDEREIMPLWMYRKMYGRYGSASNIDMKSLWPSVREMEWMKERERVEFPLTVHEMIKEAKNARMEKERSIMERQNDIAEKLKTLDKWKADLKARVEKKEREARLSLEAKQKQIDEVREIIGFQISPFDPKFKEALDKKIEEDRKRAKKEKKLRKQQMMVEKFTEMAKAEAAESSNPDSILGKKIE